MTSTEELEKLLAEATPGPWYFYDLREQKEWEGEQSYSISVGLYHVDDARYYPSAPSFADAALIVAAVNALPELLARVKRLEARVAELETPTIQWNPDDPEVPIESVEALAEHFADYGHPCGVFEVQNAHVLPYTYHFYNVMKDSQDLDDDEPIETYEVVCREITKEEYKAGQVAAAVGWFAKRAKWATDRARAALNQEPGQ